MEKGELGAYPEESNGECMHMHVFILYMYIIYIYNYVNRLIDNFEAYIGSTMVCICIHVCMFLPKICICIHVCMFLPKYAYVCIFDLPKYAYVCICEDVSLGSPMNEPLVCTLRSTRHAYACTCEYI